VPGEILLQQLPCISCSALSRPRTTCTVERYVPCSEVACRPPRQPPPPRRPRLPAGRLGVLVAVERELQLRHHLVVHHVGQARDDEHLRRPHRRQVLKVRGHVALAHLRAAARSAPRPGMYSAVHGIEQMPLAHMSTTRHALRCQAHQAHHIPFRAPCAHRAAAVLPLQALARSPCAQGRNSRGCSCTVHACTQHLHGVAKWT